MSTRAHSTQSGDHDRRFEAIVLDGDGIAMRELVPGARSLRRLIESACGHGLELAIVSESPLSVVDGRLRIRPDGGGSLVMALDLGSEVYRIGRDGPQLLRRRAVTDAEEGALSRAAQLTAERLGALGVGARISATRPDRRAIELIPSAALPNGSEAVSIARGAAREAGLADPRVRAGGPRIEIGLSDRSDSVAWIRDWLWLRGIAPPQILLAGEGLTCPDLSDADGAAVWGGGHSALLSLLRDQIVRRRRGELPVVASDPAWTLEIASEDPHLQRVHEALLTLADGRLGTRGSVLSRRSGRDPAVLMAGIYSDDGAESHLLAGPRWNELTGAGRETSHRVLDLHASVLYEQAGERRERVEASLFSSLAQPGTAVLRARGTPAADRQEPLVPPPHGHVEHGEEQGVTWMVVSGPPGCIAAAAESRVRGRGGRAVLDRVAAYEGAAEGPASWERAAVRVRLAHEAGHDALLAEHRRRWAARWEDADIMISGDPELQQAIRFGLFHMIASVAEADEAPVGARGLSGSGYRGHVFWDSDVYVLPFLSATHPPSARAMLEYRIRRLPAAMRAARQQGRQGARFPWESGRSGREVTPERLHDGRGGWTAVLTGQLEEHIVADIAWAAQTYIDWSGDDAFASGAGLELLVETARWWASRIELDDDGHGHIRGVIGPDEYHERVDDDAYTNVMARWNLCTAARAAANGTVADDERRRWLAVAEAIHDGYDARTGVYEQFSGYHRLEPLLIADFAPRRPVAADMVLGRDRTTASQVIKQADVLMLHYLVPDEVAPDSLTANLEFYEPRTAHGSTLSPGVHAALLARAGRLAEAVQMLGLTARIDLDDIGGTTARGLHLAAMGAAWRALSYGFAGLRATADGLIVDPVLPDSWHGLDLRVRFRGSRVRLRVQTGLLTATADPPILVSGPGGESMQLTAAPQTVSLVPRPERTVA